MTRTELRKYKTKVQILNAAEKVFDEDGFTKAKISDIAEKADVGYGTFYQHFENKKELIIELMQNAAAELIRENRSGEYDLLKTKDRFFQHVVEILKFYKKYRVVYMIMAEKANNDEDFALLERKMYESLYDLIHYSVQLYNAKGVCRTHIDDQVVMCIYFMIDGCGKEIIKMEDPDIEKYAESIAQTCYNILFKDSFFDIDL